MQWKVDPRNLYDLLRSRGIETSIDSILVWFVMNLIELSMAGGGERDYVPYKSLDSADFQSDIYS